MGHFFFCLLKKVTLSLKYRTPTQPGMVTHMLLCGTADRPPARAPTKADGSACSRGNARHARSFKKSDKRQHTARDEERWKKEGKKGGKRTSAQIAPTDERQENFKARSQSKDTHKLHRQRCHARTTSARTSTRSPLQQERERERERESEGGRELPGPNQKNTKHTEGWASTQKGTTAHLLHCTQAKRTARTSQKKKNT